MSPSEGPNSGISKGDAEALDKELREMRKAREEKGLCVICGKRPYNPHLRQSICLECTDSEQISHHFCDVAGCLNRSVGYFKQASLCEIHLADTVHKQYKKYLNMVDRLNRLEQAFKEGVEETGYDPRAKNIDPDEITDQEKEVRSMYFEWRMRDTEISSLKADIDRAVDALEQAFPEDYEVFG